MSQITDRAVRAVTRAMPAHLADSGDTYCQHATFPMAGYWHGPRCDGLPCQIVTALADNDELDYAHPDGFLDDLTALQASVTVARTAGPLSGLDVKAVVGALWADRLLKTAVVRLPR